MIAMSPGEVSKKLGLQPSTLRKYCLLLEQHGVVFERNANNSRKYDEVTVMTLQRMVTLINSGDMTVENASMVASNGYNTRVENLHKTPNSTDAENALERHDGDIAAAMIKEILSLKEEIQEQKAVIDGFRVAQEKRDSYFVEILEGLQNEIVKLNEQKALPEVAATEEEPEPQKKRFFSRFFK
ncbi:MerR family transcriptional regulator [Psychrobacillus sp. L3]|uniref:MerR family transcriptional regulator n=1 Tax=Psychrobacillus sp. L3 TaxID=3236891 RepID=UPI0036F3D2C5